MNKETAIQLIKIIFSLLLTAIGLAFSLPPVCELILFLLAWLACGAQVLIRAVKGIFSGSFMDENFLMSVATVCAFVLGQYAEAAAVMIFYTVGETVLDLAVDHSRRSVEALTSLCPDTVTLYENGKETVLPAENVPVGSTVVLKAGERAALDGEVIFGSAAADLSAVTGESLPITVEKGNILPAGSLITNGVLQVKTTAVLKDSTTSRMLEIVENEQNKKAKTERFITAFAKYYTPAVVLGAFLLFLVPTLILGDYGKWLGRAMTFLVVSCPCALVISVPLGFFGGIGAASRQGILIKGGDCIERLCRIDTAVFDKTGTLTTGRFNIGEVFAANGDKEELLALAATVEGCSNHPVAVCISAAATPKAEPTEVTEAAGYGIMATVDGKRVAVGNIKLMEKQGVTAKEISGGVHIAVDGKYAGYITVTDSIKSETANLCDGLKKAGIKSSYVFTGDTAAGARSITPQMGFEGVICGMLPTQKVDKLKELQQNAKGVIFIGDGINDAPVIAAADVGAAMGALGSDAAVQSADIVLVGDNPQKIITALKIARRTQNIAKQNVIFCLAVKAAVLIFGAFGIAGIWWAVFADVGVTLIATLNALRALKPGKDNKQNSA